jgi:hypothetical protein
MMVVLLENRGLRQHNRGLARGLERSVLITWMASIWGKFAEESSNEGSCGKRVNRVHRAKERPYRDCCRQSAKFAIKMRVFAIPPLFEREVCG